MFKDLLKLRGVYFFSIEILFLIIIGLLQRDEIYKLVLSNTEPSALRGVKELFSMTLWVSLLATPLIVLLRITYTATCFSLGQFISYNHDNLRFGSYFNIALKGEFVWVVFAIFNYIMFTASLDQATPFTMRYLSLVGFFEIDNTEPMLLILFSSLNIMELLYVLLMTKLHSISFNSTYSSSFYFVGKTYGLGLLFYIIILMFVTMFIMPH